MTKRILFFTIVRKKFELEIFPFFEQLVACGIDALLEQAAALLI